MKTALVIDSNAPKEALDAVPDSILKDIAVNIEVQGGELAKSIDTYVHVIESLIHNHITRDDIIIGVGGGAVLDLVGFVAATYARGIKHYKVPTTTLAAIDAAHGGKNALNVCGKNTIGTVFFPEDVFIPWGVIAKNPDHIYRDGLVEAVKIGWTSDERLFVYIEENIEHLLNRNVDVLTNVMTTAIELKMDIIDNGDRDILNFGHTIGHAIEEATVYKISHGRAVAIGMIEEVKVAGGNPERLISVLSKLVNLGCPADINFLDLSKDKKGFIITVPIIAGSPQKLELAYNGGYNEP